MRVCGTPRTGARPQLPLADAGVAERDVLAWWTAQPSDLRLRSHEGNCDLCYLKGRAKILTVMRENPALADWWVRQESKPGTSSPKGRCESLRYFRADREPYAVMLHQVEREGHFDFGGVDWEGDDCTCTD